MAGSRARRTLWFLALYAASAAAFVVIVSLLKAVVPH
jgi:hypothetical protein